MPVATDTGQRLPGWARAADVLVVGLLLLAVLVATFGGFRFRVWGIRVSVTTASLVFAWAVGLGILRHAVVRRDPIYRRASRWVAASLTSEAFAVSWPIFWATRIGVLAVGYLAVVIIGYPPDAPPFRVSRNEALNLPARWDSGWYLTIASTGYRWDEASARRGRQQNIAFFPAYPMLMRVTGRLFGSQYVAAGFAITLIAFFIALVYVFRLAREQLDHRNPEAAVALFAAYPFAFFYSALYTEALFVAAAAGAFYHFTRREWAAASAWGLLAGLARPNGFLLSVPLAVLAVQPLLASRERFSPSTMKRVVPGVVAAAMPGIGMVAYSAYVLSVTGNPLGWLEAHKAWGRSYRGLTTLVQEHYAYVAHHGIYQTTVALPIDLMNGAAAVFALLLTWPIIRRFGLAYGLFVALNVVPPLAAGGFLSVGRVTAVLFPVFLWLGDALPRRHLPAWLAGFGMGQAFGATLFFTWRPLF